MLSLNAPLCARVYFGRWFPENFSIVMKSFVDLGRHVAWQRQMGRSAEHCQKREPSHYFQNAILDAPSCLKVKFLLVQWRKFGSLVVLLLFAIVSFKKFILLTRNVPEVLGGLFSSGIWQLCCFLWNFHAVVLICFCICLSILANRLKIYLSYYLLDESC